MASFATHLTTAYPETAQNRIDQASTRLAQAFDRLEAALGKRRGPVAVESALSEQSAQLEQGLAILKEENEKLNLLLRESAAKYDQLREIAVTVAAGLDSSIGRVEEILG